VAQAVEWLPSKGKALSSNSSIVKESINNCFGELFLLQLPRIDEKIKGVIFVYVFTHLNILYGRLTFLKSEIFCGCSLIFDT
jgi:hypothetical protein